MSTVSVRRLRAVVLAAACLLPLGAAGEDWELFRRIMGPPLSPVAGLPRAEIETHRIELGRVLYHDKRLSRDDSISCNSCHDTRSFGVDSERLSPGFGGRLTGRNSPTTFNAFMHLAQFWDGREPTVEEQAKGPILAEKEMAMPSPDAVVEKLEGIPGYWELFARAFPGSDPPVTYDNVGTAIGAYERLFVTPGPFDAFLAGDDGALDARQKRGMEKFLTRGCATCHTTTLVGGALYQKLGLIRPWPSQEDQGRFDVTGREEDRMFFKVPSLRNVEKTGPWFHDGSAGDLDEAIRVMGRHQLGLELPDEDVEDIRAFLSGLTGELEESVAAPPRSFPGQG